ncbi:DASS family sodium-coupled anion symporter [bacterium]|nr:DASS family sodium-coupled anion symporter [bacterium]
MDARSTLRRFTRPTLIIFALLLFLLITNLPTPTDLTPQGQKAIAIFVVSIFLWVTHALPLMITSLLVVILFPLSGVLTTEESYALFGNEAIFFILGAFILASGVMRTGLSTRLAVLTLRHFGKSPKILLVTFLSLSAFLSFWMSEHAVAAMMLPIVLEVVDALKLPSMKSRYAKGLILSMVWGCIIGGVATFLGGARAPLAVGILLQNTGNRIGFLSWTLAALPTVLLMLVTAYFVLTRMFSPEIKDIGLARTALQRKRLALGQVSRKEKSLCILMVLTVCCWIFLGESVGLANIAIAAVVIAFAFQLLDWKEVEEDVNWGVFLMYGGAICLGFAMEQTGATEWLATHSLGYFVQSRIGFLLSLIFISLFLTEAISNTAAVALLLPLALGLATKFQIDPKIVTLALTIPSGLAFQLPMGTPATAIAFSSGFVGLRDTLVGGLILKLFALVFFALSILYYWPLIGFQF